MQLSPLGWLLNTWWQVMQRQGARRERKWREVLWPCRVWWQGTWWLAKSIKVMSSRMATEEMTTAVAARSGWLTWGRLQS